MPALLNWPHGHSSFVLPPGHSKPAGQVVQFVRVLLVPPSVYEPGEHVLHSRAPAALYLPSAPQETLVPSPPNLID